MKEAAIGIVFNKSKTEVLIVQRRDVNMWVLPGGGIDKGETPEQAVCREVFEETGLRVDVSRAIGVYTPVNKLAQKTYVFECRCVNGKLMLGSETRAIRFYPIEMLPRNFFHIHHEWIRDALLNKSEVIQRSISKVTYGHLLLYFCKHPVRVIRTLLSRLGVPFNTK